ncbi:MAG TPA: universal stress protein [Actinotalea sp.]
MRAKVVVGVDGTSSHDALLWAAQAARRRSCGLHLVHAFWTSLAGYEVAFDNAIEQQAKDRLHEQAAWVEEREPGLNVTTELAWETPASALTHRSEGAALLVVGTRHRSTMERILSGSLSYQVVAGSRCPVAVVPMASTWKEDDIVVGVDGSPDSLAAVAFAAKEADSLGVPLRVIHAWQEPALYLPPSLLSSDITKQAREMEQVVLAESVAGLREEYPDLHIDQQLVLERPATALLSRGESAQMLVVGSRGRNGVARMLLGSVSHTVVQHALCPVVVVRG